MTAADAHRPWRLFFAVAAAFNLIVGASLLLGAATLLPLVGMEAPARLMYLQLCGWFIVVFGIAYAIVARDPPRNRAIVLLGVLGKAAVPIIVGLAVTAGEASTPFFILALGDLVFAALFVVFLLRTR